MEGDKIMEVKYYICKHCGNIVEKVKNKGVPVICCGEPMQELKAGVTDAAVEKHVPVYYTVQHNYNSNIGGVLIYLQGGTTNEIRM